MDPRDALCQLKSYQLLHNFATKYMYLQIARHILVRCSVLDCVTICGRAQNYGCGGFIAWTVEFTMLDSKLYYASYLNTK